MDRDWLLIVFRDYSSYYWDGWGGDDALGGLVFGGHDLIKFVLCFLGCVGVLDSSFQAFIILSGLGRVFEQILSLLISSAMISNIVF